MSNPGKKATDDDEVEQLLQAAHDDVLLKLNVNSHMARGSASAAAMDPDLDRRFLALKKPQKPTKVDESTKTVVPKTETGSNKVAGAAADEGDLFARFAALKNSTPSHNKRENTTSDLSGDFGDNDEAKEENADEVDKVIQWAIDAARLDPSPLSDDDNTDKDTDDDTDTTDDEDDEKKTKNNKSRRKVNKK